MYNVLLFFTSTVGYISDGWGVRTFFIGNRAIYIFVISSLNYESRGYISRDNGPLLFEFFADFRFQSLSLPSPRALALSVRELSLRLYTKLPAPRSVINCFKGVRFLYEPIDICDLIMGRDWPRVGGRE